MTNNGIKSNVVRPADMLIVDTLFQSDPGYIMDFSNRTFAAFFAAELDIDIYDDCYAVAGTSKANRFRTLLRSVDSVTAIEILTALWEYRQNWLDRCCIDDPVKNAEGQYFRLVEKIKGKETDSSAQQPVAVFNIQKFDTFKQDLKALWNLDAQDRGYKFEGYLKSLFDAFGMKGRSSFRLVGEQIDGSFELDGETYLVEAKWVTAPIGVAPLDSFQARIDRKADWTRGCFISYGGFSKDGLIAFGKARKVICVEGKDIHDALDRRIPLDEALKRKVRHASETGEPFAPIEELFCS